MPAFESRSDMLRGARIERAALRKQLMKLIEYYTSIPGGDGLAEVQALQTLNDKIKRHIVSISKRRGGLGRK